MAARSLMMAAQIQSDELNDDSGAIETLSRLLTEYPGSLFAPEARDQIRNLRGDGA